MNVFNILYGLLLIVGIVFLYFLTTNEIRKDKDAKK